MNENAKHLDNLERAVKTASRLKQTEECFRILYVLPADAQLDLALFMVKRYLPVFLAHKPKTLWVEQLLGNPENWLRENAQTIPDLRGRVRIGDTFFIYALYDLLFAFNRKDRPLQLTSACCSAIKNAISARMGNVWESDDPEAVKLWQTHPLELQGKTMFDNPASLAVASREWQILIESLRKIPLPEDSYISEEKMKEYFQLWKDNEFLAISDKIIKNLSDTV
jgi:hypothetical protein